MQHGFPLDPREILGVDAEASLESIRDAYREKARRHHPDHGGDEWAFRVVKRCYEILTTERAAARVAPRPDAPAGRPAPHAPTIRPRTEEDSMRRPQWLSVGIHDQGLDPALLVDVELFQLRYAVADLMEALSRPPESRLLSCTLNFAWPGKGLAEGAADAASILPRVSRAFAPLAKKTRAVASHEQDDDGRFSAWLSFADLAKAEEALNVAHAAFRAEGLGFYQWIREMTVPRDDS